MTLKKQCITVYGVTKGGKKFRPSTPSPGMHWAYMLVDPFTGNDDIQIRWTNDEDSPVTLTVSKEFTNAENEAFKHVMDFIKLHDLTFKIEREECANCPGHPDCVSKEQN